MLVRLKAISLASAVALVALSAASAQSVEEFYTGKTVEVRIGFSVGGGYDTYARLLATHMGKHIPGNPTLVPMNEPGAGSLKLANWLYEAAPQDGTVFGIVARAAPFDPMFGNEAAKFDALKFNYIGSANNEVSVCVARADTGIEKFDDLKEKELIVGGTGPTADTVQFPKIMNAVFGTKIKIIDGYPGGNDVNLAMERGEVTGRCGWSWSSVVATRQDWLDSKYMNVLMQLSTSKHPDIPDSVPLIMDLAQSDEDAQLLRVVFARQALGRPFIAPPNIPEDRAKALRDAFMETMSDPEFLAAAKQAELEITPVSGEDVAQLVAEAYKASPEIVKRISEIVQ
ncbi:MAG: Bug family tripartite tricarboxylate transporter substrate binding protein [Propylenella sp.]